jgi:D-tagatose-1,6-bisphosphate aldolase subunit GatZ/KbaZ
VGVTSVCSAHPTVLDATLRHGADGDHIVLIEATCNQVNQDGGYTGMRPTDFRELVQQLADSAGLDPSRLVLGGDHLGPNPWRELTSDVAMAKAAKMVREYVRAGYSKIHLDTSMRCADDPPGALPTALIAQRAAQLASVAEQAATGASLDVLPRYVIGTEVPVPGGTQAGSHGIHVTTRDDVAETVDVSGIAFSALGLADAWGRVRAVVAQPGVEFSDTELFDYDSAEASDLSRFIEQQPSMVFEAHSTDYQTASALRTLVDDHFAVLKVGPGLTFAYREGVYALSHIEDVLFGDDASQVRQQLDRAMLANPVHWQGFYVGDEKQQSFARRFSRSDRSRYYWTVPAVSKAVDQMQWNLRTVRVPEELVSQYLPRQYQRVRDQELSVHPQALLRDTVRDVLDDYLAATSTAGR